MKFKKVSNIMPIELRFAALELVKRACFIASPIEIRPRGNGHKQWLWDNVGCSPWGVYFIGSCAPGGQEAQSISEEDLKWIKSALHWSRKAYQEEVRKKQQLIAELDKQVRQLIAQMAEAAACRSERRRWLPKKVKDVYTRAVPMALIARWSELFHIQSPVFTQGTLVVFKTDDDVRCRGFTIYGG